MIQSIFVEQMEEIKKLGIIKSVAWDRIIDDPHQCSWVRFEDEEGHIVKVHCTYFGDTDPEFVLINLALKKLWEQIGEDVNKNWIFTNEDLICMVNKARQLKPYTGEKIANKEMYKIGYQAPEYIY